jgi:hypothetical protein
LYVLTADIDASETAGWNDEGTSTTVLEGFKPIGNVAANFRGIFDGNGHIISGLVINRPDTYDVGLFGRISAAEVKNLGVVGGTVTGNSVVGGLVGVSSYGTVSSCYATGQVSGNNYVGGLVGFDWFGKVWNCYATGAVMGQNCIGGLVGIDEGLSVSNCYATGAVTGTSEVGGLVGQLSGCRASACYATGTVRGNSRVGGLLGANYNYIISVSNCYSTGAVTGGVEVGGLIGYTHSQVVSNSYWNTQTSGLSISAGGGAGKTTAQLKQQATFAGWDFSTVWGILEGITYPYLRSLDSDADTIPDPQDNCPQFANLDQADADGDGVGDPCDACENSPPGVPVSRFGCPYAAFDFNRDGVVDQSDLDRFTSCATGPAVFAEVLPLGCLLSPVNGFLPADHDHDRDVDSVDFAALQRCWSGPLPADPDCGN